MRTEYFFFFFFSSRRRHTRLTCDWSSDVCSSDLTRAYKETANGEDLEFVDGVPFVLANVPGGIDLLKMDCEGCEYPMFEDKRFLDHLNPAEIVMEYHQGAEPLVEILKGRGYALEVVPCGPTFGYIYAERTA